MQFKLRHKVSYRLALSLWCTRRLSLIVDTPSSSEATIRLIDEDIPGTKLQEPISFQPYNDGFCAVVLKLLQTGKRHSSMLIERSVEYSTSSYSNISL